MNNKKDKIILFGLPTNNTSQCIKLLTADGYQVDSLCKVNKIKKVKASRNTEIKPARLMIVDISQTLNICNEFYGGCGEKIPIIALVNSPSAFEQRESLYNQGILDCILYPFTEHELLFKVKAILHYSQCVCLFKPRVPSFIKKLPLINGVQVKPKDKQLVDQTCHYLQRHMDQKLNLDDVAIYMGANRSKLAATFKTVLGIGVFEWLREQRLLKAQSLLLSSELNIQAVGFEVGYENSANFSTAYKKQFNISPRQQRIKREKDTLIVD